MTYYRQFSGLDDVNEVQKVQFVERSGQLWQSREKREVSRMESEGYFTVNLKTKETPSSHQQHPGLPQRSEYPNAWTATVDSQSQSSKEAELESAVKILQSKLEYTERKIMESENNKDLLKARLDELIQQLTKAGFDPNMRPAKLISLQKARHPPKAEDTKVHATQYSEVEHHFKTVPSPLMTKRPAEVSDELWEKLLTLANEYERRLDIVKSLEDQEKLIKEQMTASHKPQPEVMDRPTGEDLARKIQGMK